MAQKTIKKARNSEFLTNCSACNEEYCKTKPPVTLPCGHNLCKPCTMQLQRRNNMIKCPVDNLDRKVNSLQINVDFLDFLELLKEQKVDVPRKRKRVTSRDSQCETLKPEENYDKILKDLRAKQKCLEDAAIKYSQLYSQALQVAFHNLNFVTYPYYGVNMFRPQ